MSDVAIDYFGASWCMPCRMMKPVVERIKEEGYRVGYFDIDENKDLTQNLNITSVPTFIVKKDGIEVNRKSGAIDINSFREMLKV